MKTTTAVQRRQGGHFPLSAMLAERADHYGAHIRDFARYAGEHGAGNEVTLALVTDYFRDHPPVMARYPANCNTRLLTLFLDKAL